MTRIEPESGRRSVRVETEAGPATEFAGLYATRAPESIAARRASQRAFPAGPERRAKRTPERQLERIDQDLTDRERAILNDLDHYRFLTTKHVQALHFHTHRTVSAAARLCRRALFRLAQLGVIEHLERRVGGIRAGSASYVWRVGPVGDRLLRRDREVPRARRKEPSLRHLDHSLAIADCYVALVTAARGGRFELLDIQPEPDSWRTYLSSGAVREVLKPDLYAVTANGEFEDHWFVEIDRATESLPTVLRKCSQYERYRRSGQEQQDGGVFPLVVWVLPEERHAARLTDSIQADRHLDHELYRITILAQFAGVISGERIMTGPTNEILIGDARSRLAVLPTHGVDMVLTSPPYFRLRDYQVSGQLGLERHVDDWVQQLTLIARGIERVLTSTGSFWLNVGDTYAINPAQGAGRKSLLLGPERLAFALTKDGWLLRNKIVWRKTNPMPTSVRDRLACTWEAVYVFVKSPQYFFDLDAVRVPHTSRVSKRGRVTSAVRGREAWRGPNSGGANGLDAIKARGLVGNPLGKNPGDVWQIASSNYRGTHRATFPLALAERAILSGCPEARCIACRSPWRRGVIRLGGTALRGALGPTCRCDAGREPGIVLDPFIGSGTTAIAAERQRRNWLGIELNPDFAREAETRIRTACAGPRAA